MPVCTLATNYAVQPTPWCQFLSPWRPHSVKGYKATSNPTVPLLVKAWLHPSNQWYCASNIVSLVAKTLEASQLLRLLGHRYPHNVIVSYSVSACTLATNDGLQPIKSHWLLRPLRLPPLVIRTKVTLDSARLDKPWIMAGFGEKSEPAHAKLAHDYSWQHCFRNISESTEQYWISGRINTYLHLQILNKYNMPMVYLNFFKRTHF